MNKNKIDQGEMTYGKFLEHYDCDESALFISDEYIVMIYDTFEKRQIKETGESVGVNIIPRDLIGHVYVFTNN